MFPGGLDAERRISANSINLPDDGDATIDAYARTAAGGADAGDLGISSESISEIPQLTTR
jgi:hypothetical protein